MRCVCVSVYVCCCCIHTYSIVLLYSSYLCVYVRARVAVRDVVCACVCIITFYTSDLRWLVGRAHAPAKSSDILVSCVRELTVKMKYMLFVRRRRRHSMEIIDTNYRFKSLSRALLGWGWLAWCVCVCLSICVSTNTLALAGRKISPVIQHTVTHRLGHIRTVCRSPDVSTLLARTSNRVSFSTRYKRVFAEAEFAHAQRAYDSVIMCSSLGSFRLVVVVRCSPIASVLRSMQKIWCANAKSIV